MLSYLKTFRMSLPEGIIMSVGIIPVERIIPSLYQEEIPVKEELLEALKKSIIISKEEENGKVRAKKNYNGR